MELVGATGGEEEASRIVEGLGDCEQGEGGVVLWDVGAELAEGRRMDGGGVEEEGAGGGGSPGGEDVQEGRLPGAARADDGEYLGRVGGEGDVPEDEVGRRGGGAMREEGGEDRRLVGRLSV